MASKVTAGLGFELSDFNHLCYHDFLPLNGSSDLISY